MFSGNYRALFVVGRLLGTAAIAFAVLSAQPIQGQAPGGGARGGAFVAAGISSAADTDKDGAISRAEWNTALLKWFTAADTAKSGPVSQEQLTTAITAALAAAPPSATGFGANGRTRRQAKDTDVAKHAGRPAGVGPGQAQGAAPGPRDVDVLRVRAHVHPPGRQDGRGAWRQDEGVDHDDLLRPGRPQSREPCKSSTWCS